MRLRAVVAVSVVLLSAGCGSGETPEQSAARSAAEQIATFCFNQVQPQSYPRISLSEERAIRACAAKALEGLEPESASDVAHILYDEFIPDGE